MSKILSSKFVRICRKAARKQHLGDNQPGRNICQRHHILRISPASRQRLRAGDRSDRKTSPPNRTPARRLSAGNRAPPNRLRGRIRRPHRRQPPRSLHLQAPTQGPLRAPKQLPPPQPAPKGRARRPQQPDRGQMGRGGAQRRLPLQARPRVRAQIGLLRGGVHGSRGRSAVLRLQASAVSARGVRAKRVGKAARVQADGKESGAVLGPEGAVLEAAGRASEEGGDVSRGGDVGDWVRSYRVGVQRRVGGRHLREFGEPRRQWHERCAGLSGL